MHFSKSFSKQYKFEVQTHIFSSTFGIPLSTWKSREFVPTKLWIFGSRMPKIWPGIKQLSDDFASLTTIHGLPHIILSKRIWMKIFWFIITVSMACGFFYQLIFQLIRTYLSYPVNVDTKVGLWWIKFFTNNSILDWLRQTCVSGGDVLHA